MRGWRGDGGGTATWLTSRRSRLTAALTPGRDEWLIAASAANFPKRGLVQPSPRARIHSGAIPGARRGLRRMQVGMGASVQTGRREAAGKGATAVAADKSRAWEAGEHLMRRLLSMLEAGVPGTL